MIDKKTKSRIFNFIRLSFRYSTQFKQARENAVHPTIKGIRGGKRYQCAICKCANTNTEIQVDHIKPVIPIGTKQKDLSLDEYANRLYCNVSNLQVVCKDCHKTKSKNERK